MIVPHDGKAMAKGVEVAERAGIPVIAYDRIIVDSNLDLYMTFDNEHVGELQAKYILEKLKDGPKPIKLVRIYGSKTDNNAALFKKGQDAALKDAIASGAVVVVHEDWADDWKPENAQAHHECRHHQARPRYRCRACLQRRHRRRRDSSAPRRGIAGKVVVTGQDAELVAVQRIVGGEQSMSIYKPVQALAKRRRRGRGGAGNRQTGDRQGRARQRQAPGADDPARRGHRDQRQRRFDGGEGRLSHARGNIWEALRGKRLRGKRPCSKRAGW